MTYICPNQVRLNSYGFLLCRACMEEGEKYETTAEALKAFCAHQHYCTCSHRAENTEQARECYHRQAFLSEQEKQV